MSVAEQVAEILREGMAGGRWRETLPGRERLARELGVNPKTVEAAVKRLMAQGWLVAQGGTRRRRIVVPADRCSPLRQLRVRVLAFDRASMASPWNIAVIERLHEAGFTANFAVKTLTELGMDVGRVERFVGRTEADGWIVTSGSREVLEWFIQQEVPAIALFGRFTGLPIACASPRMVPAMQVAVRRLVELGHRRIVMLAGESRRKPFPALFEQKFLQELDRLGLPVGRYNLPDWKPDADGLRACLDRLFSTTPPTALLFGETRFFVAGQQHLARQGIHAPEDVSLVCSDPDPSFDWCKPAVSHFRWNYEPLVRRILRWAKEVATGEEDRTQFLSDGQFIEGGTIGRVR
jgi:DNA-binding LacI/PurR family transcriptional regulator